MTISVPEVAIINQDTMRLTGVWCTILNATLLCVIFLGKPQIVLGTATEQAATLLACRNAASEVYDAAGLERVATYHANIAAAHSTRIASYRAARISAGTQAELDAAYAPARLVYNYDSLAFYTTLHTDRALAKDTRAAAMTVCSDAALGVPGPSETTTGAPGPSGTTTGAPGTSGTTTGAAEGPFCDGDRVSSHDMFGCFCIAGCKSAGACDNLVAGKLPDGTLVPPTCDGVCMCPLDQEDDGNDTPQ